MSKLYIKARFTARSQKVCWKKTFGLGLEKT